MYSSNVTHESSNTGKACVAMLAHMWFKTKVNVKMVFVAAIIGKAFATCLTFKFFLVIFCVSRVHVAFQQMVCLEGLSTQLTCCIRVASTDMVLNGIRVFEDHSAAFIGTWYGVAAMCVPKVSLHVVRPDSDPTLRANFFCNTFNFLLMRTSLEPMFFALSLRREMCLALTALVLSLTLMNLCEV